MRPWIAQGSLPVHCSRVRQTGVVAGPRVPERDDVPVAGLGGDARAPALPGSPSVLETRGCPTGRARRGFGRPPTGRCSRTPGLGAADARIVSRDRADGRCHRGHAACRPGRSSSRGPRCSSRRPRPRSPARGSRRGSRWSGHLPSVTLPAPAPATRRAAETHDDGRSRGPHLAHRSIPPSPRATGGVAAPCPGHGDPRERSRSRPSCPGPPATRDSARLPHRSVRSARSTRGGTRSKATSSPLTPAASPKTMSRRFTGSYAAGVGTPQHRRRGSPSGPPSRRRHTSGDHWRPPSAPPPRRRRRRGTSPRSRRAVRGLGAGPLPDARADVEEPHLGGDRLRAVHDEPVDGGVVDAHVAALPSRQAAGGCPRVRLDVVVPCSTPYTRPDAGS